MKVIIIGPAYPYRGGIADTNHSLCRALNQLGHDCSLVTFKLQYPNLLFPGKNQYTDDPAPKDLVINRKVNSLNPFSWFSTAKYINSQRADVVIIRYWLPFMAPALGSIAKRLNKKTTTLAMCDNVLPHEKRFGDRFLTSFFTSKVDGFVTLSNHVSQELKEFTNKKILSLFHPINSNLAPRISREQARQKLNLKKDDQVVLFFGLIRAYKGLDLLIKSLDCEPLKNSNLKLVIAGEFYEDRIKYDNLISSLNLNNQVFIHDHFIPNEDLATYFCAADLLAQTYKSASQSGVTQMAYHFNLPLLVTDVGGLTEMVAENRVGIISKPDPNEIAKGIHRFFNDELAVEFKSNLETDLNLYSWKGFASKVLEEFNLNNKADSNMKSKPALS